MALILFDIDGTLLWSAGAGGDAFVAAASEVVGRELSRENVPFAGGLDPALFRDLLLAHDVRPTDELERRFRERYRAHLAACLEAGKARALPGAAELVAALDEFADIALGLLTGNYPDTAEMKLRAVGIDPERFAVRAFGDDAPTRRGLPAVAMRRWEDRELRPVEPGEVVLIGDTPQDIDCARHAGCRSLAVATGPYEVAELLAAGADLAVEDLSGTRAVIDWIRRSDAR